MTLTRLSTTILTILFLSQGMAGQEKNPARLAEMGQVKRAKQEYLKAYNQGRNQPDLYYNIGKLYLKSGQPDSAAFFFQKGTEIEQKNPMNWVGLARYYYQVGDSTKAKENLKTAEKLGRNHPDYFLGLAELYMQPNPGKPDLAETYIDKALELKSNNPYAHILRGDHFMKQGAAGEAANEYKEAIYFDKHNPETYFKAGIVYEKGRMYQDAISSMKKAIENDSLFSPAYRELGEIYLIFDKYHLARESYDKYMSLIDPETRDYIRYASILVLDKDFESASKVIEKLKSDNIQDPKLFRIQAYTDYETGQYASGLAEIRNFFDKAAADDIITSDYEYYAQLLIKNNLDSLAIPQYLKVIEIDSTKRGYYEKIAKICEKIKDFPSAAHYYELNLVNKEPSPADYFKIGWLYYLAASNKMSADSLEHLNRMQEASRFFSKVCDLAPDNYLGWFWKARAEALMDPETEAGLAKPYYEKALTLMEVTPDKYQKEMTEALKYLGYFFYLKFEKASIEAKKEEIPVFRDSSVSYWNRIITIDPNDKQAQDAIKALTKKGRS